MRRIGLSIVISLALLTSCEREVDLNVPKLPSKLAVYATWDREQALSVYVAKTVNAGDSSEPEHFYDPSRPFLTAEELRKEFYCVKNAEVMVYKNQTLHDKLVYDTDKFIYKSASGKTAAADGQYSIKVAAPGYTDVSAPVMTFPAPVAIQSVTTRKDAAPGEFSGSYLDEVTIEFQDAATTKNWYHLKLFPKSQSTSNNSRIYTIIYPLDNDVVVTPTIEPIDGKPFVFSDEIILSDENFNGKLKKLVLRFEPWSFRLGNEIKGTVMLHHISEDQFKYIKSRILNTEDIFNTPVPPYTNITNGYGIFGLFTTSIKEM